jgi:hypothetical protein
MEPVVQRALGHPKLGGPRFDGHRPPEGGHWARGHTHAVIVSQAGAAMRAHRLGEARWCGLSALRARSARRLS